MNEPKYLQALTLRQQGLKYAEIAKMLHVQPVTVSSYLNKARHQEQDLAISRRANTRYYNNHKQEISEKRKGYWRKYQEELWRRRLTTVIDGKPKTFYHLNKRKRPELCELCHKFRLKLYYHHWDDTDLNKGMWICGQCHRFSGRVERGWVEAYHRLKDILEKQFTEADRGSHCPAIPIHRSAEKNY